MNFTRTTLALLGLAFVVAACDTMDGGTPPQLMDDEQNPGTQPSNPGASGGVFD